MKQEAILMFNASRQKSWRKEAECCQVPTWVTLSLSRWQLSSNFKQH